MRLTTAEAIVRYLSAQKIIIDNQISPLFAGVFAIFGHGNVTCLGHALANAKQQLPTWRGQNEQTMAHAAIAFSKARQRQQIMVATSSVGPGATNMVTAAAVAHANRLPILILSGDYFANRCPDPVLQQVEHFHAPSISVNNSFEAVTRYWDRITHPQQILQSLPQAIQTMLDPANCGPAFIGLCQDTQEQAFDYPDQFFAETIHYWRRPQADPREIEHAASIIKQAQKPLIIAGGGVHYAQAEADLRQFAHQHQIPVVETVAGRSCLLHKDPCFAGPIGVTGSDGANALAQQADLVIAVGTRLQDFTTGSWTAFNHGAQFIGINAARFDAYKHQSHAVVGDAKISLQQISLILDTHQSAKDWFNHAQIQKQQWDKTMQDFVMHSTMLNYGQVISTINQACHEDDYVITAAGGFPGELNKLWQTKSVASFDCEYGFSCMGYEIAGGWGAKMAKPNGDVFVLVGDGSYLMGNSDIYSSVLTGHKLIILVCDNKGFAVIDRLQRNKGGESFNNQISDCHIQNEFYVDFAQHAQSMGALTRQVNNQQALQEAIQWAQQNTKTTVISMSVDPYAWSPGGCWWDVGVPEVSLSQSVNEARQQQIQGRTNQRLGI